MKDANIPGRARFEMSDEEFYTLSQIVEQHVGIHFPKEKQREFQIKLEKLPRGFCGESATELIQAANVSGEVLGKVVNALTVGESYFFRNRPHFAALRSSIFPDLIADVEGRRKKLSIWSAGCSTGEEPYSLAMLIYDDFPFLKHWDVSIIATDINTEYLANARRGVYRKWSMRGVEPQIIKRHFHEDSDGNYTLHEDIKRMVSFRRFNLANLLDGARPTSASLDLILCRNVLIYFPFRIGDQIISNMQEMIRRGGYLMVGHSESFPSLGNFEAINDHATYYYRRYVNEQTALFSMPAQETAVIPGLAVRTTFVPGPYRITVAPAISKEKEVEPETVDEQLERAREMANSGQNSEAFAFLGELSDNDGRLDYRVHFLLALIADHSGYVLKAVDSLKRCIFLNKGFIVGHYYLGVVYQREGDNESAKRSFKNVLRLLEALDDDEQLEEAEGLSAGRLREIVTSLFEEININ